MSIENGIDISIPYRTEENATSAWYVGPMEVEPVRMGDWVGAVKEGGSVNFNNLRINPHGNGTHTECVGHIAPECFSVNQHLKKWMFDALLITIEPSNVGQDKVITLEQILAVMQSTSQYEANVQFESDLHSSDDIKIPEALILRTLPNTNHKLHHNYSNSNPPYLEAKATAWMAEQGIDHLLLDLPSVDREEDGGELAAHHAFWNYPDAPRMHATITEFIYVPSEVTDGWYRLNLQVAPIENDASPSRPVLYPL